MASTKRGSIPLAIFQVIFSLPFLGGGLLAIRQGLTSGKPSQVPFGLIFVGVAAFIIVQAVRRTRSSESLAVVQTPGAAAVLPVPTFAGDYRTPGRTRLPAGALYANVLQSAALPKIATRPGFVLPIALPVSGGVGGPIGLLVFSSIWLLFSTPAFLATLIGKAFAGAAVTGLFVVVGVLLFVSTVRKLVGRTKLPQVEVAEEPLYLGDTLRVHLAQPGPATIRRLQVDLLCRERVRYTVGTTTRTEEKDILAFPLLDDPGATIPRGRSQAHDLEMAIPRNAPSTFFAKNNNVAWLLRIRADIANFPDYDEVYEVRVLPEPPLS